MRSVNLCKSVWLIALSSSFPHLVFVLVLVDLAITMSRNEKSFSGEQFMVLLVTQKRTVATLKHFKNNFSFMGLRSIQTDSGEPHSL